MRKIINYLREVRAELKKVSWPSWKQVWYSTLIVIVFSLVVSVYLGIIDMIFTALFKSVLG